MVNDADRGSHANGEITHSWMKILFGQALGGAEGRSVPNGFSIWATYWEGSYCPWVVGGQRSVGTWEICWVFLVSVIISVLRHFLDMLKFFTGPIANGTQPQARGSMSNFLHIGQNK